MKKNISGHFPRKEVSILLVLVIATMLSLELAIGLNKVSAVRNFSAQKRKIYVLCAAEAGESWVNKGEYQDVVVGYLKALGLEYELIDSVDKWGALIKEAPEGIIVINCHGELIPIPTSYGDDHVSFYKDLAELIKDKGWIFITMTGYGSYLIGNSKTVGMTVIVDDSGASVFFSALGLSYHQPGAPDLINPWCDQRAKLSGSLGKNVSSAIGMSIPETVDAPRALAVAVDQLPEHVKVLWYWYKVPESAKMWQGYPYLAVVAFKIGKGMLVWGGLGGGSIGAKMAVLATAYILNPELATMKVRVPLLTRRYIFVYSLVAVGAIFAAFGLVLLFKRSVPPESV